jgi:hypothetical protein
MEPLRSKDARQQHWKNTERRETGDTESGFGKRVIAV